MTYEAIINLPISHNEVPELREANGWDRRDDDFPLLFHRCNFWAGVRDQENKLIGFGYIAGMGLQHGYMEDILISPDYQNLGIGGQLVKTLLHEAKNTGLEIVTLTFNEKHTRFYQNCGFTSCTGGVWRAK
ncbi:N-acetyltransferase [Jeotgalibacillus sp. S-D1]|nr:N-acetyltransferase [Jeotgalibacillus sp. S-D1]